MVSKLGGGGGGEGGSEVMVVVLSTSSPLLTINQVNHMHTHAHAHARTRTLNQSSGDARTTHTLIVATCDKFSNKPHILS
jgi:hypothetical protein